MTDAAGALVRPRDAASLIVLRGRGEAAEVLLGRRARRHRFLPDMYVFPGGRVDPADARLRPLAGYPPETAAALARWRGGRARALGCAAVRETLEEAGLLVGRLDGGRLRPDLSGLAYLGRAITPTASPIRFHARFFEWRADVADADIRDSHELTDLRFVPLARALELPLIDVTEFLIGHLRRREAGQAPAGHPFFRYSHGRPRIDYE